MIKYKTGWAYNDIEEVEILRETDRSVWVEKSTGGTCQHPKHSTNSNYWDTWEIAHSYLMRVVQRKIDKLQRQLIAEEKKLAEIAWMRRK